VNKIKNNLILSIFEIYGDSQSVSLSYS